MTKKRYCIFIGLSLILFAGYSLSIKAGEPVDEKINKSIVVTSPPITVWVHGSKIIGETIFPNFFYCPLGFHNAQELDKKYHHRSIAESLSQTDSERFPLETFYFFGWPGNLSFKMRKQVAGQLSDCLKKISKEYYQEYRQNPYIRIITHSHGGNVALNLATVKDDSDVGTISELILLACPIQNQTKNNSKDPIFDKIISLYSTLDPIQVLDPQGMYPKDVREIQQHYEKHTKTPLFSKRVLEPHENIIQAKLKINGRGIFHMEFLFARFLKQLPKILDTLENHTKEKKDAYKKSLLLNITRAKVIQIKEIR